MTSYSQNIGIIPTPQQVKQEEGIFIWDKNTILCYETNDNHIFNIVNDFKNDMNEIIGFKNQIINKKAKKKQKVVIFQMIDSIPAKENQNQAYIIDIQPNTIYIKALTKQGLFYGTQSLKQLIRYQHIKYGNIEIPCMHITDWPSIEYRGWMDDISRGPIPTMDFIKKEIRTLAEYKLNFFNLYTEHVFKLNKYPDIAPTDGLTAKEIKELNEYANKYYIEFIGNQQCFAHAEKTLCNPFYYDIMDTRFNFNPGSENTYRFLENVFSEVLPVYESKFFNINCDETESLGNGRAKSYIDSIGKDRAYCQHIDKVNNILKKYDKEVMMWGDIIAKNPDMIKKLPEDMQFIIWNYDDRDDYTEIIEPFKESGHIFWVAPGASMWNTCFPDIQTYIKNIANFSRDGYRFGTKGVMNTAWDDRGESLFNEAWHSMIWCAEVTWNVLKENKDEERKKREDIFNQNFNIQYFNSTDKNYVTDLYMLSKMIRKPSTSKLMDFTTLFEPLFEFYPSQVDSAATVECIDAQYYINLVYQTLLTDRNLLKKNTEIFDLATAAAYRAYVTVLKNELKIQLYNTLQNPSNENIGKTHKKLSQFIDSLHNMKNLFINVWDMESRAYSRNIVIERYDKIAKEILNADKHVFINTDISEDGFPVVSLKTIFNKNQIYYTIDGSIPDKSSNLYHKPFKINKSCLVKAICYDEYDDHEIIERYILYHKGIGHFMKLNAPVGNYRPEYSGGGDDALLNGIIGSTNYKDGNWQGFYGNDCDIEINFGKKENLNSIKINFLTNPYDWILMPSVVNIYTSKEGIQYHLFKTCNIKEEVPSTINTITHKTLNTDGLSTQYLRIIVENPGRIPKGLPGYDNQSWIFMDEIIIE